MDSTLLVGLVVAGFVAYLFWRRRSPTPFPPWLTPLLRSPWRRRGFSPEVAADRHGLHAGMTVLEIGPGDGYLTAAAFERVRPSGRLFCLDIQLPMLRKLRGKLGAQTPPLVCASGSALPLRSRAFDLVFLVHVLGEVRDRAGALREFARVLRSGGVLSVTEGLPDPDFIRRGRLIRMAGSAGFHALEHTGGRFHYTQRFCIQEGSA